MCECNIKRTKEREQSKGTKGERRKGTVQRKRANEENKVRMKGGKSKINSNREREREREKEREKKKGCGEWNICTLHRLIVAYFSNVM
jgi:hypothetical protein